MDGGKRLAELVVLVVSDWREWLGRLGSIAENGTPDVADEFEELIDGFILLAEVHEAKAALDEHNKSCDWAFLGKNSACLNCMKLQQKHAGAHEAADDFLRGVGRD